MDKELLAVAAVSKVISKTDYLVANINSNDKEPSWDGFIYVYNQAGTNHPKKELFGRVPVQVKGHESINDKNVEISYQVEVSDLSNYLNDGGTVYFVVCFDNNGENEKIYYIKLLPYDLKCILNKVDKQQTKSIKLKPFPNDKNKIVDIFFNFVNDRHKQLAAIGMENIILKDINWKSGTHKFSMGYITVSDFKNENLNSLEFLFSKEMYLYMHTEYDIPFPIGCIEIEAYSTKLKGDISVKGKTYYTEYEIINKSNKIKEVHLGKSFVIVFDKNESNIEFKFASKGKLSERIIDCEFMSKILSEKNMIINNNKMPLFELSKSDNFDKEKLQEYLDWLYKIRELLNRLDVSIDLDLDLLKEKDYATIDLLINSVLNGNEVSLKNIEHVGCFFNIGNLKILTCVFRNEKSGKYKVYNFFDPGINFKFYNKEGILEAAPISLLLNKQVFLECSNVSVLKVINNIEKEWYSENIADDVNLLLLEVLLAYDNKTDNDYLLDLAEKINNNIKKKYKAFPSDIIRLNELQIIRRKRPLNSDEKFDLLNYAKVKSDNEQIITAAYLLLDEQIEAKRHFEKMSEEEQKIFEKLPIYSFWKK